MRVINIKNIHHLPIYYVLLSLLLLTSTVVYGIENDRRSSKLEKNAEKQQQKLVDQYGLMESKIWQQRCDELIHELNLHEFNACLLLKADHPNAYSLAHGLVILTEGLLKLIKNSDQLAHVLAHEHAHLVLEHHQQAQALINNPPTFFTKSRIKKFYRNIEQEADLAANNLLIEHGRDPLQVQHYLLRIEKDNRKNKRKEQSDDHHKLKDRIQRKNLPAENDNGWNVD